MDSIHDAQSMLSIIIVAVPSIAIASLLSIPFSKFRV